jgi:hypothetical protein
MQQRSRQGLSIKREHHAVQPGAAESNKRAAALITAARQTVQISSLCWQLRVPPAAVSANSSRAARCGAEGLFLQAA